MDHMAVLAVPKKMEYVPHIPMSCSKFHGQLGKNVHLFGCGGIFQPCPEFSFFGTVIFFGSAMKHTIIFFGCALDNLRLKSPNISWEFFPYQSSKSTTKKIELLEVYLHSISSTYLEVSGDWRIGPHFLSNRNSLEKSAHVTLHTRLPPVKSVSQTIAVKR